MIETGRAVLPFVGIEHTVLHLNRVCTSERRTFLALVHSHRRAGPDGILTMLRLSHLNCLRAGVNVYNSIGNLLRAVTFTCQPIRGISAPAKC